MIDAIDWSAMTVKQEAEGEPYAGKLAVAFVIVNRMEKKRRCASDIVLAPWQFSCWNTESPTKMRLEVDLSLSIWRDSYAAASAAFHRTVEDPTRGSTSYLNPRLCTEAQRQRAGYEKSSIRASIGQHEFFIA
jgi:spore germination cell wall hydrolase CwlJ-like protein